MAEIPEDLKSLYDRLKKLDPTIAELINRIATLTAEKAQADQVARLEKPVSDEEFVAKGHEMNKSRNMEDSASLGEVATALIADRKGAK